MQDDIQNVKIRPYHILWIYSTEEHPVILYIYSVNDITAIVAVPVWSTAYGGCRGASCVITIYHPSLWSAFVFPSACCPAIMDKQVIISYYKIYWTERQNLSKMIKITSMWNIVAPIDCFDVESSILLKRLCK